MKLSGPEARARKVKAADAVTHDSPAEPVFQFDPLIEISPRAWDAIGSWKEYGIELPNDWIGNTPERQWRDFFQTLPTAVYLKLMNPERFGNLDMVKGKTQTTLPPDLIRRERPDWFEAGLLNQMFQVPERDLSAHQHKIRYDAKSVFGMALAERTAWNTNEHSSKRYLEQPAMLQEIVNRFTEGGFTLDELALYAGALPELHEYLSRFRVDFQLAKQTFRRKLTFALRNLESADWRDVIKDAFTLTLLGSDPELTKDGLVIKKRHGSSIQNPPTLPVRPSV